MLGEVIFDAGGSRYTLFLGNAAQCAVEEHFDKGFFAVVADAMPAIDPQTAMAVARAMSDGGEMPPEIAAKAVEAMRGIRVSLLRELAWYGLQKHHPQITHDQVSDLVDVMGQAQFGDIIGRAIRAAQGGGSGDDAAPGKARRATPRRARTGPRSLRNGVQPA